MTEPRIHEFAYDEAAARIDEAARNNAEELNLADLGLRALPTSINGLTSLKTLHLSNNKLNALPEGLAELTSLTTLYLAFNRLKELPAWITSFRDLKDLSVSGNHLRTLPEWLGRLQGLDTLSASACELTKLPASIGDLSGLDMLFLSENHLASLPPSISNLTRLSGLDLDGNQFTEIPACVTELNSLRILGMARNDLRSLPASLGRMPELRRLDLDGNPFEDLDPAIIDAGFDAVRNHLRSKEATGETKNWRSRVLFVGESAVGKTSLVRALTNLEHRPGEQTTHGMSVSKLPLAHPHEPSATMDLALWDFGGQPNYQACHQFFFSGRSLFIVVWDTRNGSDRDRVVHWIETVTARAPNAPILVVATHADERAADLDTDLTTRFQQVIGTCAVDCSGERTGIADLRARIAEAASTLPLMGLTWSSSWGQAARALRSHPGPQVSLAELRTLMRDAGVEDSAVPDLIRIFHSLGDVLYPESVSRRVIGDIVTLDPAWLNGRISQILDRQAIQDRIGVLTQADLREIWPDLDRDSRDYLLAMTEEYDLTYPITDPGDSEAVALVVDRLARNEPDLSAWHAAGQDPAMRRLRIRYVPGKALPGIPAWFIAREYRFSSGRAWRRGALLRDARNDDWALIRTADDGTVDLEVRGRYAPARFLGILDDGLHQTFGRYPGLEVVRRVPCPCQGFQAPDCPHGYKEDVIHRRLADGKTTISCSESGEDVGLAELLEGISPTRKTLRSDDHQWSAALMRENELMAQIAAASADMTLRALQEQLQREFSRNRSIKQVTCPSVVTLAEKKKKLGKTVYRLHLWCDQPGAWHRLPTETGSYELSEPDQWLRALSPHVRRVAKILSVTLPVGKAVIGLAADEVAGHAHDELKTWHDDLAHVPAKFPSVPEPADSLADIGAAGRVVPQRIALLDSDYRILEHALLTLDPKRKWGGLNRVETPEGQVFYLCDAHAREYDRRPVQLRPME